MTELHVWMLCVRLSDDGAEGKFCRDQLMTAMWEDLDTRAKKLGPMVASLRNEQIQETSHHFKVKLPDIVIIVHRLSSEIEVHGSMH